MVSSIAPPPPPSELELHELITRNPLLQEIMGDSLNTCTSLSKVILLIPVSHSAKKKFYFSVHIIFRKQILNG